MNLVLHRTAFVATGLLLAFLGFFIIWQNVAQPSSNGCYTFPTLTFTFLPILIAYQGTCPYNSIPTYYAMDLGGILIVLGYLPAVTNIKKKSIEIG